jgi:ribosome-associated protein
MSNFDPHYDDDDLEFEKSKSQIKREMEALQALGRKLTELKPAQLKKVPISEDLGQAIRESYNIRQREAKRRHLQFIGKLMRAEDSEAIQYAIDQFDSSSQRYAQEFHQMESWRDRLITQGNEALSSFIEENPETDVQHLRALVRNAKKDADNEKNTGAGKKLFQYIRSLTQSLD